MALSIDIGNIEPTAEAKQAQRSDGRNLKELATVGTDIANLINRDRVNKFNDELDEVTGDVFATSGTDNEGRIAPLTGDPDADVLLENIYALEDGIGQSSGSRKSALGLELRKVYDSFSNRYPKLRGALATELSRFEATDPEIAAMDLLAQEDRTDLVLQSRDLERIKDQAYTTLGMSPGTTKFGSIEFAREFADRNRNVQAKVVNDQILEAQESKQDLDVNSYLNTFQKGMTGEASDTTETFQLFREDISTFQLALSDPTQPGAKETITLFNNGQSQALQAKIQSDIYEAQRRFNVIPIRYADNEKYKAARAVLDSHVQMLSGFLEGLEQSNPTLVKAYETYATAQMIEFEAEHRDIVQLNRQVRAFKDVFEMTDETFGGEGAIVKHELGQISIQSLEAMIGKDLALSTGIPKTARTAGELRLAYSAQTQGVRDITGNGAQSQAERQQFLIEEQVVKNQDDYLRLAGEGVLAPARAADFMTAQGQRLVAVNQSGPLDWTGQKTVLEAWATPEILNLAKISAEVNPALAQVAAEELGNISHDYDIHRVNTYIDQLNTKIYGQLLGESILVTNMITPNFDDIANGNVTFTFDQPEISRRINAHYPGQSVGTHKAAQHKMEQAVRELGIMVSKDLKWLAHIEALHNGTYEADYATQYDLSFIEMRLPREDGQSQAN